MKPRIAIAIAFALTFANLVGAASVKSAPLIIQARGRVELKSKNSNYYRPTNVGESLDYGDMLKPALEATVRVLCDDSNVEELMPGVSSGLNSICPIPDHGRFRPVKISPLGGGSERQIPYILSPRMTYLLNDKPTFSWNGVEGVNRYTVSLFLDGEILEWSDKVSSTEMDYPKNKPPLEVGVPYLLTVETDNGISSCKDSGANLGFQFLNQNHVDDVKDKEEAIEKEDLKYEDEELALTALYSNKYLITDAINKLKDLGERPVERPVEQTTLLYRWLGDLYTGAGLNLKAEEFYSKAIELFTAPQDRYELAKAKAGLAGVKLMLRKKDEAEQLKNQAIAEYQDLGYSEMVEELEKRLEKVVDQEAGSCRGEILTPGDLFPPGVLFPPSF
ncbi:MAG: tetratricopeptide repeat protein [Pleurocapsa sp. MO_226.B13]|nr:tetratricopeptide repeat protein [Pleurocapsa sp. MO_226.B13]